MPHSECQMERPEYIYILYYIYIYICLYTYNNYMPYILPDDMSETLPEEFVRVAITRSKVLGKLLSGSRYYPSKRLGMAHTLW